MVKKLAFFGSLTSKGLNVPPVQVTFFGWQVVDQCHGKLGVLTRSLVLIEACPKVFPPPRNNLRSGKVGTGADVGQLSLASGPVITRVSCLTVTSFPSNKSLSYS